MRKPSKLETRLYLFGAALIAVLSVNAIGYIECYR
jgi:hypothetical protein